MHLLFPVHFPLSIYPLFRCLRVIYVWFGANWSQTMEVATARVYNWDVVQRRKDKADGKGDEDDDTAKGPSGA